MTATDLWPDFVIDPKPRGIRQVLEEAGEGLKQKTKGLVEFRVYPESATDSGLPFRYPCYLRVPRLDYDFYLLDVYSAATGYPAELRTELDRTLVDNEAALLAALGRAFRSERTVAIVQNLISMATE